MRRQGQNRRAGGSEGGYALLLIMFLLALLVLGTTVVAPNALTTGKREKEAEMVWRGKQYVRGIRMYYMKFNKFPHSMDDLVKSNNGIRFLRQAYKDPMNKTDGSWRFIYVGPNGQLIGSLKNRTMGPGGIGGAGMGQPMAGGSSFGNSSFGQSSFGGSGSGSSFGSASFGNSSFGNSSFGNSSFGNSTMGAQQQNTAVGQTPGTGTGTDPNNPNGTATDEMGVPKDLASADLPATIIGGNIIGVGSKINEKSILWYDKAKNYKLFEFVWDPSKDMGQGRATAGVGTPVQNMNGTNANGTNTTGIGGTGINGQNPGQTNMQQNPAQNPTTNPGQDPNNPGVPLTAPQ